MAKDPELTTKWFVANRDDAEQIALKFHRSEALFERKVQQIWRAIEGRPKKEVIGLIEWLLKKRKEQRQRDPDEPFDAAKILTEWREGKERAA